MPSKDVARIVSYQKECRNVLYLIVQQSAEQVALQLNRIGEPQDGGYLVSAGRLVAGRRTAAAARRRRAAATNNNWAR